MVVKYKTSYGIALCRFNKDKNYQSEILMINKRYTYSYFSFVFGLYKTYNIKQLQKLFNNMTFAEKIEILSMKFSAMWYKLWLCDPEKNFEIKMYNKKTDDKQSHKNIKCYFRKKNKFESIFLQDGGKRLKNLINNSTNSVTPWEIPKGRKDDNETELECAMREIKEETNINNNTYTVLWNVDPIKFSHKDDGVVYNSIYYLAYMNNDSNWQPRINFNSINQLSEVEEVRWISLNDIKFLGLNEIYKKRLIFIYKKILYYFKCNIKSNYYLIV